MRYYGITDKGTIRNDNQDSFLVEKCDVAKSLVFALCDGMGGAKAGGIASSLSNKIFVSEIYKKLLVLSNSKINYAKILQDACKNVNGIAFNYSLFDDSYTGMGTTLVGGVVNDKGEAHLINIGDSRAYHISEGYTKISQITRDHSYVEHLVEAGLLTREEARNHPNKNVITRAVGSDEDIEGDYFRVQLHSRDILLLCSDGLSNTLTDEEILNYASEHAEPEALCAALLGEALKRDVRDNITIVAIQR